MGHKVSTRYFLYL